MQAVRCGLLGHGGYTLGGAPPVPWGGHEQPVVDPARTYEVRTYGCQMNVHDSERLTGLLEEAGYVAAPADEQADVVVFNTCAVRENADNKLYGNLGHLAPVKAAAARHADRRGRLPGPEGPRHDHHEGAVGRRRLRHPQHRLPAGPARARPRAGGGAGRDPRVARGLPVDAADPARVGVRRVGVSVSVGCNNTCTFCIVPEPARQGEGPPARRHPGRDPGAGRRGRQRGHAARAERQRVRRGVRRPAGVLEAAACLRRDRGARAGALHLAPPGGVQRRRDRGDGRDART